MIEPIKPDAASAIAKDATADIQYMIESINEKICVNIKYHSGASQAYAYENPDGTHDRFRCVIDYEEGNVGATLHEELVWKAYHKEIMAAYERVGWGVRRWFTHIPKSIVYCLYILDASADEIIANLQDGILKP